MQGLGLVDAYLALHVCVIPEQLIHAAGEGKAHQCVNGEELEDIDDHAAQRDLQWSEVRIHGKYVHQFE